MPAPRKYPDELKERSVASSSRSGRPIAHVAPDLGIQIRVAAALGPPGGSNAGDRADRLTISERERLKMLKREVKDLRKSTEVLKAGLGAR